MNQIFFLYCCLKYWINEPAFEKIKAYFKVDSRYKNSADTNEEVNLYLKRIRALVKSKQMLIERIALFPIATFLPILLGKYLKDTWVSISIYNLSSIVIFYIVVHLIGISIVFVMMSMTSFENGVLGLKRKRVAYLGDEQIGEMSHQVFKILQEVHKKEILETSDTKHIRIVDIVRKLLSKNIDIDRINNMVWTITVIKEDTKNAFVLPTGNIFIYTGMIDFCESDDELAIILGHEMSHALLSHVKELSFLEILSKCMTFSPLMINWVIFPKNVAICIDLLIHLITKVTCELPIHRQQEIEADKIGILLAGKACFDVRSAPQFWHKMINELNSKDSTKNKDGDKKKNIGISEYFSTHPSLCHREQYLLDLLPIAENVRIYCNCQYLNDRVVQPISDACNISNAVKEFIISAIFQFISQAFWYAIYVRIF